MTSPDSHASYDLIAICPEETKEICEKEILSLGSTEITGKFFRAVRFRCDEETYYKAHLRLRTVSRLLRVLTQFQAPHEDIILKRCAKFPWEKYMHPSQTFMVEGVSTNRGRKAMSSMILSKKVREGLQQYFQKKEGLLPRVNLEEPDITFVMYMERQLCILSVDTTGKSLHKRGYRLDNHPAPIKETLAAAILLLAGYDGSQLLWDPMCGSGTIGIEGAYLALGKAPLIHRSKGDFGFENLVDFNRALWRRVQEDAREAKSNELNHGIFLSDISEEFVAAARKNALRARVEKHLTFTQADFLAADTQPPGPKGLIVCNLPYGERLAKDSKALEKFYGDVGRKLKFQCAGWTAALLVLRDSPYQKLGLKPRQSFQLLNGSKEVKLLIFDLFKGSAKDKNKI